MKKFYRNAVSRIVVIVLLSHCAGFSNGADDQDPNRAPIVAVAACDSFVEIREQCAWLGGLIGFPILGGLPDTYAMMATGGKGLQGLDAKRPIGVVFSAQEDAPVIHGFLPATDAKILIETFADIPFRSMVDMTAAGE
ncbi:MAG: hypothetical protein ACR2NI_01980, partial [Pirellulales bacterium]